ncbi:MAG TPA: hypothetical protein PLC47_09580, partial [Bacteroidales bacterium]|nr:hypothetical protein [Bacteroidales bacterium]
MENTPTTKAKSYDVLDMHNYRIEKLPKRSKSKIERSLAIVGIPLSILAFVYFGFFAHISFLYDFDPASVLAGKAKAAYDLLGAEGFIRSNHLMLAIFMGSIILWITEAIPNYLT